MGAITPSTMEHSVICAACTHSEMCQVMWWFGHFPSGLTAGLILSGIKGTNLLSKFYFLVT